jgi:type IV pilus assembly protein PilA
VDGEPPTHGVDGPWRFGRGFTLIELLVVVVVLTVLAAIAVPTFLGSRSRSQDRVAQANLRSALSGAGILTGDAGGVTASALGGVESSLRFVAGTTASTEPGTVSVSTSGASFALAARAATGTCWMIRSMNGAVTYGGVDLAACTGAEAMTRAVEPGFGTVNRRSYSAAVMADNPSAYWRFDRAVAGAVPLLAGSSGVIQLGYGITGPFTADPGTGFEGRAAFTAPSHVGSGTFTVSFWMRPTGHDQIPLSFGLVNLWFRSDGFGFNSSVGDIWGAPAPPLNTWTHVAAVVSNNSRAGLRLFLNGVEQTLTQRVGTTPVGFTTAGTSARLGDYTGGGYAFTGTLAELAFFSGALDPVRIAAHAALGDAAAYAAAVSADGPSAYWRFDRAVAGAVPLLAGSSGVIQLGGVGAAGPFTADPGTGFEGRAAFTAPSHVGSGTFTVSFWMRPTGHNQIPLSFGNANLWYRSEGFGFNSTSNDVWGAPAPPLNTWTHVAAVVSNGSRAGLRLFLNGVEQTLTQRVGVTPVGYTTAGTSARLGDYTGGGYTFTGTIAELAFFSGTLDPARIAAHAALNQP